MAYVWKRHPRYSLFLALILLTTCFLLFPSSSDSFPPSFDGEFVGHSGMSRYNGVPVPGEGNGFSNDVAMRLKRSERFYEKALKDRKALLKRFGPRPEDVETFPDHDKPYTIWNFFPAAFNCPYEVRHLGTLADGGKWVCGLSQMEEEKDCVIYSFGISGDSTFEADLLQNTAHCKIWGYDFSVDGFTEDIPKGERWRTTFNKYGLAGKDRVGTAGGDPTMYSLKTLMGMNNHTHIDLLKIDIEGWEFETLEELIKPYILSGTPLPFAQLQLEIHVWEMGFGKFLKWWEMLEEAGLRPFWTEPNLVYVDYAKATPSLTEYSFINIKGDNVLLRPAMQQTKTRPKHPHGP